MSNPAAGRIRKEYNMFQKDESAKLAGITLEAENDDLSLFRATVKGPPESVYEGGVFALEVIIPSTYPMIPPKIKFITKVWHPNISSSSGCICVDFLKDQWAGAMMLQTVLLMLQNLLINPEPDDPQDFVVASQYIKDRELFNSTAREWTALYASPDNVAKLPEDPKVTQLTSMGFDKSKATSVLKQCNGDVNQALELLLSGS